MSKLRQCKIQLNLAVGGPCLEPSCENGAPRTSRISVTPQSMGETNRVSAYGHSCGRLNYGSNMEDPSLVHDRARAWNGRDSRIWGTCSWKASVQTRPKVAILSRSPPQKSVADFFHLASHEHRIQYWSVNSWTIDCWQSKWEPWISDILVKSLTTRLVFQNSASSRIRRREFPGFPVAYQLSTMKPLWSRTEIPSVGSMFLWRLPLQRLSCASLWIRTLLKNQPKVSQLRPWSWFFSIPPRWTAFIPPTIRIGRDSQCPLNSTHVAPQQSHPGGVVSPDCHRLIECRE